MHRRSSRYTILLAVLSVAIMAAFISWRAIDKNKMEVPSVVFLNLAVIGPPLLLTAGIVAAYRREYVGQFPERADDVGTDRYILPAALFVVIAVGIATALIFRDSAGAVFYAERQSTADGLNVEPSLVLGRASVPIYFTLAGRPLPGGGYDLESTAIRIPTATLWLAFLGAMVSNAGIITRRFSIRHLVPKVYLFGAMRFLYAVVVTVVFYIAILTWPELTGSIIVDPVEQRHLILLVAFVTGMYPQSILQLLTGRVQAILKWRSRPQLRLTEIQGINPQLEVFLYEEGLWSVMDLAKRDPAIIAREAQLDEALVRSWRSQAQLLVELEDRQTIQRFRDLGINDWDDLVVLADVDIPIVEQDFVMATAPEDREITPVLLRILKEKYVAQAGDASGSAARSDDVSV